MLRVVSHPEADEELEAAARWYETRQPELGDDFLDDFELALRRAIQNPQRPRFIQGENRKLNFNRFPYAIVYELKKEILYVKAVMHLHRRPFYWRHRQ
jgi:plasmid stabilization system protein ParE